jgi:flagellar basal-body rod protein FlgF
MQSDSAKLDRIAMNMANASTPGYRREVGALPPIGATSRGNSFAAYLGAGEAQSASMRSTAGASLGAQATATVADTRAGTFKSTGRGLDLALTGTEFFEIGTDAGPAYTRAGEFHVDVRGRLVTAGGNPVMGRGGEIVLTTPNPTIDGTGMVRENGNVVAQLKIVAFENAKSMARLGDGLWAPGEGMQIAADNATVVRQGYLENSNVSSLTEMRELIETMRHFESVQRMTQGYDEMIGNAIRKLGEA